MTKKHEPSQLLIFKFLRHISTHRSVLRKASRLKSYCKFNNYFLNPHLFLKKSFGFNFRLQIKGEAEESLYPLHQPVEHIYLPVSIMQHFRVIIQHKEIFRIMTLYYYGDICNLHFRYYIFLQTAQFLNNFQR